MRRASAVNISTEKQPDLKQGFRSLAGILSFLLRYRRRVALCLALLLVNISIEMTLPQLVGQAITSLRWRLEWGADFQLRSFVLVFAALVSTRAGVGYILGPIRNKLVQRTLGDIRAAVYDAIQRLAFPYHDRSSSGELISRSTTDVWRLQDFLFATLFLSVDIVAALLVTVLLIFFTSPLLGFVTLGVMAPTITLIAIYGAKLQPRWRQVHDLHSAMTTVIHENIAGVRVVKAFGREESELGKFGAKRDEFLTNLMDTINYWAARVPTAQFIFGLGVPLVLWVGGRLVIKNELPVGDLVKVLLYLMAIGYRVGMVGQFTTIVLTASASAERVMEIIREPKLIQSGHRSLPAGRGEVAFQNVSFAYQAGKASLQEVSFRAEAGKTYAIVGPTGSGKTTLVNLIPRYYEVTSGAVLIDGVDVRDLVLGDLRRAVSVIFQDTFLFSASVAENIAFGKPGASREEIERCARAAQAHEFISALESGYDTIIGERGITLSGGQKQRIAGARAFLMNPRILILDDATSSIDSETERLMQEAFRELCAGRTTFVIAHRLSTVKNADEILVLRDGRIVERGSHAQLAHADSFYQEMFQGQIQ